MSDLNIKYAKLFSIIINSTEVINAELMESIEKAQKTADEADIRKPLGVLGSFYKCDNATDTKPKLIATGKDTKSGMDEELLKCNEWALLEEFTSVNSKISTDTSNSDVYVSISSTGGCFNVVGDLRTLPVLANTSVSVKDSIPSLEVVCLDSVCKTVEIVTEFGYDSYTIPSLAVTCINSVCTTETGNAFSDRYSYNISIPSLVVGYMSPTAGSLNSMCVYELDHQL